jgi:uncharacterized protein (DUF2236 family)
LRTTRTASVEPILPPFEQAASLVPPRGSITWRRAGDARLFLAAGYALLLQVAHPTVGAGVREHSNFRQDPWGRLLRTLDFTNVMVYGGPELAFEMGRRVRGMHKQIKGVDSAGRHYHALEPEAYAWVHATLAEAIVAGHARFGRPLSRDQVEQLWAEWRAMGRLLGVRADDLPEDWAGFRRYFDAMVADRLEDTESVHDVLDTLGEPIRPPIPHLGDAAWRAARVPAGRLNRVATAGMLPPLLRKRFGITWTRAQELELRALSAAARSATPAMPAALRNMGPGYLRWRGEALTRGPAGPALPAAAA